MTVLNNLKLTSIKYHDKIKNIIGMFPSQFFGDYNIPFYKKEHFIVKCIVVCAIALSILLLVSITALIVLTYQYMLHEHPPIIFIKIKSLLSSAPTLAVFLSLLLAGLGFILKIELDKDVCDEMIDWISIFKKQVKAYKEYEYPKTRKEGLVWIKYAYKESSNLKVNLPTSLEMFK